MNGRKLTRHHAELQNATNEHIQNLQSQNWNKDPTKDPLTRQENVIYKDIGRSTVAANGEKFETSPERLQIEGSFDYENPAHQKAIENFLKRALFRNDEASFQRHFPNLKKYWDQGVYGFFKTAMINGAKKIIDSNIELKKQLRRQSRDSRTDIQCNFAANLVYENNKVYIDTKIDEVVFSYYYGFKGDIEDEKGETRIPGTIKSRWLIDKGNDFIKVKFSNPLLQDLCLQNTVDVKQRVELIRKQLTKLQAELEAQKEKLEKAPDVQEYSRSPSSTRRKSVRISTYNSVVDLHSLALAAAQDPISAALEFNARLPQEEAKIAAELLEEQKSDAQQMINDLKKIVLEKRQRAEKSIRAELEKSPDQQLSRCAMTDLAVYTNKSSLQLPYIDVASGFKNINRQFIDEDTNNILNEMQRLASRPLRSYRKAQEVYEILSQRDKDPIEILDECKIKLLHTVLNKEKARLEAIILKESPEKNIGLLNYVASARLSPKANAAYEKYNAFDAIQTTLNANDKSPKEKLNDFKSGLEQHRPVFEKNRDDVTDKVLKWIATILSGGIAAFFVWDVESGKTAQNLVSVLGMFKKTNTPARKPLAAPIAELMPRRG